MIKLLSIVFNGDGKILQFKQFSKKKRKDDGDDIEKMDFVQTFCAASFGEIWVKVNGDRVDIP